MIFENIFQIFQSTGSRNSTSVAEIMNEIILQVVKVRTYAKSDTACPPLSAASERLFSVAGLVYAEW